MLVFLLWTLVTFNIYLLAGSVELYMINPPWVWSEDGLQLLALNTSGYFLMCLILNLFKTPLGGTSNLIAQFTYQIIYGTEFGWDCFITSLLLEMNQSIQWAHESTNRSDLGIILNLLSRTCSYLICFYIIRILSWPLEYFFNDLGPSNELLIDFSIWNGLVNSLPREFAEALCAILRGYIFIVFRRVFVWG